MKIKTLLCSFLRFEKQCDYVATEAGRFNSDVLAITPKNRILEFEIKVSLSDFMADFKKPKHEVFRGEVPSYHASCFEDRNYLTNEDGSAKYVIPRLLQENIPWKFYFVVTEEIYEKCKAYLDKIDSPYGLYTFKVNRLGQNWIELDRKARVIKDQFATEGIKGMLAKRMSSELCGLRSQIASMKLNAPKIEMPDS